MGKVQTLPLPHPIYIESADDPEAVEISPIGSVTNAAEHAVVSDPNQLLIRLSPGVRHVFFRVLGPRGPA